MMFEQIDRLGRSRTPFFFMIDFACRRMVVLPLSALSSQGISVEFKGKHYGLDVEPVSSRKQGVKIHPIEAGVYSRSFSKVQDGIQAGNSYLLNLTFPTDVYTDYTLEDIFIAAKAAYKVYYKDKFVFFSPEAFIRIVDDKIYSYPMKGTIDAALPHALDELMGSSKELCEHYTIVDLIRNDLALVSSNVCVEKFRYHEKIETASGRQIYQTSSIIRGELNESWKDNIGGMLRKLLPAGSISGAPKAKTLEIIQSAELDDRGFYSGVTGIFDGNSLDSCVNIRFIERVDKGVYKYRSGGGITCNSSCRDEYDELITKVYVPSLF